MSKYEHVDEPDKEPDEFEINRLVLLRNGFDLAHTRRQHTRILSLVYYLDATPKWKPR